MDKMKKRLKYLWIFAKPYKGSFVNAFLCIVFTSIISMLYPLVFGLLVDEVFYNKDLNFFIIIVIGYFAIYLVEQLLHLILNIIWPYQFHVYLLEIRRAVYKKIISLKYEKISTMPLGDLIGKVNWQSDAFVELLHRNLAYLFANTIKVALIIVIVFMVSPYLGALLLISVPISYYVSFILGKKIGEKKVGANESYKNFQSWIFEMISGIRDLKLIDAGKTVAEKCRGLLEIYNKKIQVMTKAEIFSDRVCALIAIITDISLYVISGILIYQDKITVGAFIAVISYFEVSNSLLKGINKYWGMIHGNNVIIDDVIQILEAPVDENDKEKDIVISKGDISLKNLSFSYGEKKVLNNISVNIKAGERVAIVGKSGAGKSTIVNIMMGLLSAEKGQVYIDSTDISEVNVKSIRNQLGIVQQEVFVFDGTIRDNLKIANENCSDDEMAEAIIKAGLGEYFENLENGLDTIVGQEGINMSGGEKQRIAIARLLLRNAKILIFDEPTSSLDSETESYVINVWNETIQNKTSIIIAHRLSTILNADKVLVLKDGELCGYGNHDELLSNNECYQELFREQYLSREKVVNRI